MHLCVLDLPWISVTSSPLHTSTRYICPAGKYLYIVHHPCNPNHSILHEMCVPHTWNLMLSVPPFPPTEASLASFFVTAATYDIVSELKALLFLVTFGDFTINIVSQKCSR